MPPTKRRNTSSASFSAQSNTAPLDAEYRDGASAFCFGAQALPACLTREFHSLTPSRQQQVGVDILGLQKAPTHIISDNTSTASTAAAMTVDGDNDSEVEEPNDDITPDMLDALETNLEQLITSKPSQAAAYRMARERDVHGSYVNSLAFRAQFLRAVDYEAKRAAVRMCKHFTIKLDLFGADMLHKPVSISDLSEDDMTALESGGFQVLPSNDRAGRPILFGRYTSMKYRVKENMLRALWYIWMTMVEDPKHQKSGIIAIGYENGRTPLERFEEEKECEDSDIDDSDDEDDDDDRFHLQDGSAGFDRALARGILNIPLALPIRPVAYHICADGDRPQWQDVSDMVLVTLCKFVRLRMRFHHGTPLECQYAMLTHGIPVEGFPKISEDGHVDLTNHRNWIEQRRRLERERAETTEPDVFGF